MNSILSCAAWERRHSINIYFVDKLKWTEPCGKWRVSYTNKQRVIWLFNSHISTTIWISQYLFVTTHNQHRNCEQFAFFPLGFFLFCRYIVSFYYYSSFFACQFTYTHTLQTKNWNANSVIVLLERWSKWFCSLSATATAALAVAVSIEHAVFVNSLHTTVSILVVHPNLKYLYWIFSNFEFESKLTNFN